MVTVASVEVLSKIDSVAAELAGAREGEELL
jgi:hypothetical protein